MRDIDKAKLAEELKQARRRVTELETALADRDSIPPVDYITFKTFFDAATDSFSIWDSNLNMIYLNDATLLKYYPPGTQRADVIGKHFTELVPGCVESGRYARYLNVIKTGEPVYIDEFSPHPRFGDMYLEIRVFKIDNGLGIITIDNTERKRAEQTIQDNQQRLSALIENAPDVIFTYDTSGRFVSGNKKAEELMGYSREELLGKTFAESGIFTEESLAKASERLAESIKGKETQPIPFELIAKDGASIFLEVHSVPIIQGDKVEVIAIARDITERKRIEEQLLQSEEKLRAVFESIGDSITVIDANGDITDLNDAAVKLFGCKNKEEVLGIQALRFIVEEDQPSATGKLNEAKTERMVQYKFKRMDDSIFWGETSSDALLDSSRNITGFIGIVRDITNRKKTEEALRQSEEKFRVIFNSIADGISVIDITTGKLIDTNEAALRMFNFTREDVIGTYGFDLIAEKNRLSAIEDFARTLEKGYSGLNEWCLLGKGGTEHDCEATSAVIRDKSGSPISLVNVMRDISERKRMEEKLRQSEEMLRQSEEKIRQIFNSVGVGISVTDMEGNVTEINDFGLRLCGCSKEEMIGHNGIRLIAERDRPRIIKEMIEAFKTGTSGIQEFTSVKKDGTEYETEAIITVMLDRYRKPAGLITSVTDITERKRVERELKDYKANLESMVQERTAELADTYEKLRENDEITRTFYENISDSIYAHDIEGRFLYANKKCENLTGYSREELIGKSIFEIGALPQKHFNFVQRGLNSIHDADKAGKPYEIDLTTKTGETIYMEVVSFPVSRKGKTEILGIGRDITERKRMEQELQRKERYFRALTESSADGIMVLNRDGSIRYESQGCLHILGYTEEERIGHSVLDPMHPDDAQAARDAFYRLMEGGSGHTELRARHKDGSWHYLDVTLSNLLNDPAVEGLVVNLHDITERRKVEEDLRESEERFRSLVENASEIIFSLDPKGKVTYLSPSVEASIGYKPTELIGTYFKELALPEDLKYIADKFRLTIGGEHGRAEFRVRAKSGDVRIIQTSSSLIIRNGEAIGLTGVGTDVTERKKAEAALQEKEALLRSFFNSPGLICGIVELEADDIRYITVNAAMADMYSLTPEAIANKLASEIGTDKGIVRLFIENYKKSRENDAPAYFEYQRGVGQEKRWLYVTVTFLGSELSNNKARYAFVTTDITERRKAEEALRESEEKYRGIFDESIATVYVFDAKKNFINTNQAGLDLLGYSREELLRMSIPDVDADPVVVLPAHQELLTGGRLINYEHRLRRKDGTIVSVLNNSRPLTDGNGNVVGMLSTLIDITERKQIEEALQESEERLRVFFENVPDILFAHNMEGQFTDMNKKALEISGYSRDDIIGKNILETGILPLDQIEGVIAGIKGIEDGKSGYPYEVQLAKKNGERITVDAVSFPMRRKGRLEVMGIAHDITKRKEMENALLASEEKLRAIFEAIEDGLAVADLEGNLIDMNEADIRLFGYKSKEQLFGINAFQFVTEADRPRVIRDMSAVLTTESGKVDRYRLMDKDGNEFDAEVSGSLLRDRQGKPAAIVNIIRDITQRKRLEESLKESEAKYRTLVEQSEQGICILQNGRIVFTNKALSKLNGYSIKEMYALSSEELMRLTVHPGDKEAYVKHIKMRLAGKRLRSRQEYRAIRKDGTELCFETYSKRILYKGQPAIQSTMLDITERKQWESSLQQSKSDLSFYLSQINQAQEEERKRIARELHDDTIQEIVALSRQLDNLIDKKIGPEEERRENRRLIEDAQRKLDTILKGIRRFTRDLRPSILDDLGLVPALEWLTTDISEQFKIPIKISIRGKEQTIASDAALVMFRIAQESLRNACRHAGATRIQVNLKYTSQKVTLSITDNGQGFDLPEDTSNLIRRGKLGVAGMYERAQLIGASLSIKSNKNKGSSVTLEVNIK